MKRVADQPMTSLARHGWESLFPTFRDTPPRVIRASLAEIIEDASPQQVSAWDRSIPQLQHEVGEVLEHEREARMYTAILEYELPLESRRPDAVFLVNGAVVVIELKGKLTASQADIDQAAAYARDLRCYHRECQDKPVHAVLVPTRAKGYLGHECGVHIAGPDALDRLVADLERRGTALIDAHAFLAEDAYRPLPTLVQAARELFLRRDVRWIHRARAATDPAVEEVTRIIHEAARTRTKRLVLLTGIPGAGKTLVGLQIVHAHFLDDLVVAREGGKPTVPAVFLSGNGPLVEVLQYELQSAGGGGKTFVRGVKDYVKRYSKSPKSVPPEHVLVFDEAQRAFDAEQVRQKHTKTPGFGGGKSEPEHFIEFAERIPQWCVVLGLIGGGQEIHVGEEEGLVQWRHAIEGAAAPNDWTIHGPPGTSSFFDGSRLAFENSDRLSLDREIRYHFASELHRFVADLLEVVPAAENAAIADRLEAASYALRITRDLAVARQYLRDRYGEEPLRRYGIAASSRDKDLVRFGIANDYQTTKRVKIGPWYTEAEDAPSGLSCRLLIDCVTEYGAQGLELDAVLLAWGTDLQLRDGRWSNAKARRYKKGAHVKDPLQLRLNAYRVLLTRGRDGTVAFVPPLPELDATFAYLRDSGFRQL